MLVITRRDGEEIVVRIPGRIQPLVIRCCSVKGERVRIGCVADSDIKINRREIDDEIQRALAAKFDSAKV